MTQEGLKLEPFAFRIVTEAAFLKTFNEAASNIELNLIPKPSYRSAVALASLPGSCNKIQSYLKEAIMLEGDYYEKKRCGEEEKKINLNFVVPDDRSV